MSDSPGFETHPGSEQILSRFNAAWQSGRVPELNDYLAAAPQAAQVALFGELLSIELIYRRKLGESPQASDYLAKFPQFAQQIEHGIGAGMDAEVTQVPLACQLVSETDRNLLFGLLAMQMDFISRDTLVEALRDWVLQKGQPLGEVLVQRGDLSASRRELLEPLVDEHVRQHANDPAASFAAISSVVGAEVDWDRVVDADIAARVAARRLARSAIRPIVNCVVFSPNGKRLASGGNDKAIKVWDAETGKEIFTISRPTDWVQSVAFSPDGKSLVSGGSDKVVKFWDATNGQEAFALEGHTGGIRSVAFSPDGTLLASASADQTVKIWNIASRHEAFTLKGHSAGIRSVVFSNDGKRVASASSDQTVKVWDALSGQETLTLKGHIGEVNGVAFSPDGNRLASAAYDGTVKVWDARPWTPELRVEREALSLIDAFRLRGNPKAEWLDLIRTNRTINEPVRQRAQQFVRDWQD